MIGIRAFPKAWRITARRRLIPFASATVIYWRPISSRIALRVSLAQTPILGSASVIAGRINPEPSEIPLLGRIFHCSAKIKIRTMAIQKPGTDRATVENVPRTWSSSRSFFTAIRTPDPTPKTIVKIMLKPASFNEIGIRFASWSMTLLFVKNERPRSPCTRPSTQLKYWTTAGWSRPIFAAMASYSACV